MIDVIAAIQTRTSAGSFDRTHAMTQSEVEELVELASHAPTSYNQQNWRCIAVTSSKMKHQLQEVANGQTKVIDAAVTFVLIGDTLGFEKMAAILRPSESACEEVIRAYDNRLMAARSLYGSSPQMQRDEAIRSASLVGMTLMLAAIGKGYASCPMIGFDPAGVSELLRLSSSEVPALLITVGRAAEGNPPRKPRRSANAVMTMV